MKKILKKLEKILEEVIACHACLTRVSSAIAGNKTTLNSLADSIEYQIELTDTLMNNRYEDDTTLSTVVIVPYRGKPYVYKDGKKLSSDTMTSFDVSWAWDRKAEVTVNNE